MIEKRKLESLSEEMQKVSCGHGCVFGSPKGMGPNVACYCLESVHRPRQRVIMRCIRLLRQEYNRLEDVD